MSNEGDTISRVVNNFISDLADVGGLYTITCAIGAVIYWLFVKPLQDLHLAICFNKLKVQICQQEGLISDKESFDDQYEQRLGCCFDIYVLISKRVPSFISCFFCSLRSKDDPSDCMTFEKME